MFKKTNEAVFGTSNAARIKREAFLISASENMMMICVLLEDEEDE